MECALCVAASHRSTKVSDHRDPDTGVIGRFNAEDGERRVSERRYTASVVAVPLDYDSDPERFDLVGRYGLAGDTHDLVAPRLVTERLEPMLDVGCGRGRLALLVPPALTWVGLDASPTQLVNCPRRPVVLADAARLPFPNDVFGSVAALWMLYHLDQPIQAIREANRVLRPGGLFATCTDSRFNNPEIVDERQASTFDAEEAPDLVSSIFGEVEVEPWDGPFVHLPDVQAVGEFVRAQLIDPKLIKPITPPLTVTKRGCLVYAYKRP